MDALPAERQNRVVRRFLLWLLALAGIAYLVVAVWGLNAGLNDLNNVLWLFVMVPAIPLAGVLILIKRPEHPVGWLLTLTGFAFPLIPTLLEIPTMVVFERSGVRNWMWAAIWAYETFTAIAAVLFTTLLILLPDGKIRYRRERRFMVGAWAVVVFPTLVMSSHPVVVTSAMSFPGVSGIPSRLFIPGWEPFGPILEAMSTLAYLILLGAIALLFMRYRTAPIRERKQIRWVLFGGMVAILVGSVPFVLSELGVVGPLEHGSVTAAVTSMISFGLFPTSVVIAVLEPSWVDVDIVIRKSFVYGALSFVILLVYIGVASAFGVAAGARLGLNVEVAVVLTVVVAILFQPARRRLQRLADRWVFGARPSKYEAVTGFGETLEHSNDPAGLMPQLVETIRLSLRLRWVSALLDDGTQAATGPASGDAVLNIPIGTGDEQIGEIACGPKDEGSLSNDETQLVRTLAGQLGLALMNARLAARIVTAAESERRRIERNIHDGAQQELVALVAKLGMARSAASQGSLSSEAVDDLRHEAQQILSDLRELAQGIHPAVLSDGGIVEAVEDRCARLPLDVSVQSSPGLRALRFPDDVEGAAYFFVTESLTNVLKHAGASRTAVFLTRDRGHLLLEVRDDGRGFNMDAIPQNGLAGLRDRIRALGGTVTVVSEPGLGTCVSASIPVVVP
jgi:signal transduction histidine kinase